MKRGLITDYVLQSFEDDTWKPDLNACMRGGRGRPKNRWNTTKQRQWSIQRNALFTEVGFLKRFLNCYSKGTRSSQVTEAIASFLRVQWWTMSWSRCQHLPTNQPLGGAACLSWRSTFSSSVLASPKLWAQHPEALTYTPHIFTVALLLHLYSVQSKGDRAILPCEIMHWYVLLVPLAHRRR